MDEGRTPDTPEPAATGRRSRGPLVLGLGALAAVGLGAAVALGVFRDDSTPETPPPAAEGGLKVELGQTDGDTRIDPARPLRCFADGAFVGELTLADCAKRNGVAAQALDVGVDAAGELAAAVTPPAQEPEPPGADAADPDPDPAPYRVVGPRSPPPPPPRAQAMGSCQRDAGGEWRNVGDTLTLDTCVQLLFTGRCEAPGSASYGRWNGQTVRLVTGRVEIAPDGSNFRTLVEQDASCMLP